MRPATKGGVPDTIRGANNYFPLSYATITVEPGRSVPGARHHDEGTLVAVL